MGSSHRPHSHSPIGLKLDALTSQVRHSSRQRHHHNASPPPHPQPAPSEMLSGLLLEDAILFNATRKVNNPPDKVFFTGLLAGFWVGIGGLAAVSAAGGVPEEVRHAWLSLPKFLMGAFFAFALHFIALFGGDLFTGNTMVLAVGWYNRVVPLRRILFNWLIVYLGNWAGCLLTAYFLGYLTDLFDYPQYRSYLDEVVVAKLEHLNWGQIFLRAIPANTMVCMAVMLGLSARDAAGKIMALWFPVVMFVLCSFEHCVANMFFTSLGLMYGAHSSIGRLWYNQSAAVLGNLIGGAIFIGLLEHLLNHWRSPILRSHHHQDGTLVGHDVESTRRARDSHPHSLFQHHQGPCPEIKIDDTTTGSGNASQEAMDTETREGKQRTGDEQVGGQAAAAGAVSSRSSSAIWRTLGRSSPEKKDATDNV